MAIAIALGFLTAFVVGELGFLVARSTAERPRTAIQATGAEPVVEAFYAGINAWIATEDRSLELVLAPAFVDHTTSDAPDRNDQEFFAYLNAVRTAVPSLRFEILAIEGTGATVSVDLTGEAGHPPMIQGWRSVLPAQPSFREILRIEGGQIAERWSIDDLWPSGSLSVERELPVGAESYRQPSIQRFVLEPSSSFDLTVLGPVVLWVESGELALEMSGTDQAGVTRFPTEPLVPGSLRMVEPSSGKLRVRALGLEGVELWTAGLDAVSLPVAPAGMGYGNLPSGIEQDAGVALALQLRGQDVQLSVLVVTLPSGSVLSTSAASMHAAVVVSGALQAQPETGEIFYCFNGSRSRLLTGFETAHSGAGFANQRGGSAFYQVTGPDPATLVLVAIHPVVPSPAHLIRTGPG